MPQTVSIELKSTSWNPLESFWRLKQSTSLVLQQMFSGLCLELFYQASFWKWKTTNRGSTVMQKTTKNSSKGSVTNNLKSDTTNLVFLYTLLWFAFFDFGDFIILIVCGIYSQYVKSTVGELEEHQQPLEPQLEIPPRNLFKAYCFQLVARFLLGILFISLQKTVFYPSNFTCDLMRNDQPSENNTQTQTYECHNQRATKKNVWT